MNWMRISIITFLIGILLSCVSGQVIFKSTLFEANTGGFNCYRTPAIVRLANSHLMVFVEGRIGSSNVSECGLSSSKKNIVARLSTDNGRNWNPQVSLFDCNCGSGFECGYPSVVTDLITNTTWLMYSTGTGTQVTSTNNGLTWTTSTTLAINNDAKNPSVGHGIQLDNTCGNANVGRLLLPFVCGQHSLRDQSSPYHSCIVYSDDNGKTWDLGAIAQAGSREGELIQTSNCKSGMGQSIYLNARNYAGPQPLGRRLYSWSTDSGKTFSSEGLDSQLIEPVTKDWTGIVGSVLRFKTPSTEYILFSDTDNASDRKNVTIRYSTDFGKSWSDGITVYGGPSSYTDMIQMDDTTVGIAYEGGVTSPYDTIEFDLVKIL